MQMQFIQLLMRPLDAAHPQINEQLNGSADG